MYEVAFALYEQPGVPRERALAHWGTTHAALVNKVPGVRRYLQGGTFLSEGERPFLGIAVLSFDDQAAFTTAAGSPEFAAAVADLANFADAAKLPTVQLVAP